MCNTVKGIILVKIGIKTGKNKQTNKKSKNWYKYPKDTYFLDKVTNMLKLELNELPSQ